MPESTSRQRAISLEQQILRRLCSSGVGGRDQATADALRELESYGWRDSDHHVIADALSRLSAKSHPWTREELAAEATRLGFPDISWNDYFEPASCDEPGANRPLAELVRQLLALCGPTS